MGEIEKRQEIVQMEDGWLVVKGLKPISKEKWKELAILLKAAFPEIEKEFLVILFGFLLESGMSEKRVEQKVRDVILTCKRLPRVADFVEIPRIKLYTYQEMQDYLWDKYKSDWVYYQDEFLDYGGYFVLKKEYQGLLKDLK